MSAQFPSVLDTALPLRGVRVEFMARAGSLLRAPGSAPWGRRVLSPGRDAPSANLNAEEAGLMSTYDKRQRPQVVASNAQPMRRHPAREPGQYVGEAHRVRILSAMAQLVCEHGIEPVTVSSVVGLAGVSRRTFYLLFENRDDCLHAVLEEAVALVAERVEPAYRSRERWVDGVRAGLLALLELFDEQPELAQLCVVQSLAAPAATLARRSEILDDLAAAVDEGRAQARVPSTLPPLTAEAVVGGALAVIHARLIRRDAQPLVELLNPLMATIVLPYLGGAAALREMSRAVPRRPFVPAKPRPAPNPLKGLNTRLTYRTMRVIAVIAVQPGLSNSEVAQRAGISDQGQISKLLARLAGLGLLENTGEGQPKGAPNAWQLTLKGRKVEWAFARETGAAGRWWRTA
jgi:AcrR family transcriptional regulator